MKEIIEVRNLTKYFGEICAVKNLSFTVFRGEVYGFLGQNGAGKSTTIRMLLSLIKPTKGEIKISGLNIKEHKKTILSDIGAVVEKPDLYRYLSAYDNIDLFARLSGKKLSHSEILQQLNKVGLSKRAHSKVKTFSQGMKQRLGIAVALAHDPQLIILDEPTNGLDPQGLSDTRQLVLRLSKEEGKTLLISSHLLNEVEQIADRVLIIDKGEKIAEGPVHDLFRSGGSVMEIRTLDPLWDFSSIEASAWSDFVIEKRSGYLKIKIPTEQIPDLNKYLVAASTPILSFKTLNTLEDFFLSVTTPGEHVDTYKN